MKKIIKMEFGIWWLIFAAAIAAKFIIFGNATGSIFSSPAYEKYGLLFKVVTIILWASVFGSFLNWIYVKISKNSNPKIHLSIIGFLILLSFVVL